MKRLLLLIVCVGLLAACSSGSKTKPASTPTNRSEITTAVTCSSMVGKTLTAADAQDVCKGTDGVVYPAGSTTCTNGQTYLTFGKDAAGLVGQAAKAITATPTLDRDTCIAS